MNSFIENKKHELLLLCEQYKVSKLELFGSATTASQFDIKDSDLDFLVEFLPLSPKEHADAYFGLLSELERVFEKTVDLVETNAISNPYFLATISETRTLLYAA